MNKISRTEASMCLNCDGDVLKTYIQYAVNTILEGKKMMS